MSEIAELEGLVAKHMPADIPEVLPPIIKPQIKTREERLAESREHWAKNDSSRLSRAAEQRRSALRTASRLLELENQPHSALGMAVSALLARVNKGDIQNLEQAKAYLDRAIEV